MSRFQSMSAWQHDRHLQRSLGRWLRPVLRVAGVSVAATGVAAVSVAPRRLEVVQARVVIPHLPDAWVGLRVAHLSDFHLGERNVSRAMLWRLRRVVEEWSADIVAFTGDYFNDGRITPDDGFFTGWKARIGTYAVLGNHDQRRGLDVCDAICARLTAGGVTLLRNRSIALERDGSVLWLAGVDDPHTWRADLPQALADVPLEHDVTLLLAHSPAVVAAVPTGRVRLTLSGHTHGGQVRVTRSGRIPGLRVIRRLLRDNLQRNEPSIFRGWHWVHGGLVLVSNGLGVSRVPARLFSPPQLLLLELANDGQDVRRACDDPRRYVTLSHPRRSITQRRRSG